MEEPTVNNRPTKPKRLMGFSASACRLSHALPITIVCVLCLLSPTLRANEPDIIQLEALPGNVDRPVVTALSLTSNGKLIAAAGDDHAVRLVSLQDREVMHTWEPHQDWVRAVRFSPSGDRLASVANDGCIHVVDVGSKQKIASSQTLHALHDVCFVDEETLFAVGFHASIYRWTISEPEPSIDHMSDCRDLRTISYCPVNQLLAYGGRDGVLRLREVTPQGSIPYAMMPAHFDRIRSVQFSEDGRVLTSVGEDRRLIHFDTRNKGIIGTMDLKGGKLVGLCPIDQERFAVAGSDNTINIVNWNQSTPKTRLIGHDGTVTLLSVTKNLLVSSSFDTTIRIWDLEKAVQQQDETGRYIHPVAAQFEDSGALSKQGILVRRVKP
jgi:WD40 repeat protein